MKELNEVVEFAAGSTVSLVAFPNWFTASVAENVLLPTGKVATRHARVSDAWMMWPLRRSIRRLAYDPARRPLVIVDGPDGPEFNCWPGWAVEPTDGDVTPFVNLVDYLYQDAGPGEKDWFLDWCAYPFVHPGAKLATTVVLFGLTQGTGKTTVGETLGAIYGKNYITITQEVVMGRFTEWSKNRQFVLCDDVSGTERRETHDHIKTMITKRTVWIDGKNKTEYELPSTINFMWTSNNPAALYLERHDRRFYVHEAKADAKPASFYVSYRKWLAAGGAGALFGWFLRRDLSKFNPYAKAMATRAKAEMTSLSFSDVERWAADLRRAPDDYLRRLDTDPPEPHDIVPYSRLRLLCASQLGVDEARIGGLYRALIAAGVPRVHAGAPVSIPGAKVDRYYAVRNAKRWESATLDEIQRHIIGPHASSGATVTPISTTKRAKKY